MDFFTSEFGYTALFLASFLASTVLPFGSEWVLVAMVAGSFSPLPCVAVATAGNTLGAITTYAIGFFGSAFLLTRVLRIDAASRQKAERFYNTYGVWSLLLSWLPVVGDPLCLVGGLAKVRLSLFVPLVLLGKLARYAALAWATVSLA